MARLRGLMWLVAGIVLALLAGLVAFQTLTRAAEVPSQTGENSPIVTVIAALRPVLVRTILTADDLQELDLPAASVPEGAVTDIELVVGRLTEVDLAPGEVILARRLIDPNVVSGDGRKGVALDEDKVLMAIPAQDLLTKVKIYKPGDHIDIMFSLDFPTTRGVASSTEDNKTELSSFYTLQNVEIVGLTGLLNPAPTTGEKVDPAAGVPDALLVTLNAQDALTVKYLIDSGGTIDTVLRAPGVERPFEPDPVDYDYVIKRYQIPYEQGR